MTAGKWLTVSYRNFLPSRFYCIHSMIFYHSDVVCGGKADHVGICTQCIAAWGRWFHQCQQNGQWSPHPSWPLSTLQLTWNSALPLSSLYLIRVWLPSSFGNMWLFFPELHRKHIRKQSPTRKVNRRVRKRAAISLQEKGCRALSYLHNKKSRATKMDPIAPPPNSCDAGGMFSQFTWSGQPHTRTFSSVDV